jgi:coatomer subunit beta
LQGKYISVIFELLNSQSHAVKYEAASALVSLTSHTSAVKAAASAFIDLANKESDNNIKLIVLDRIADLQSKYAKILSDLVLDFMKVLASPDLQVREKCLQIILDLTNSRNVEQVLQLLQKELVKSRNDTFERINDYRVSLIKSIHSCSTKFSELQSTAVDGVLDFISDPHQPFAFEIIQFIKHVLETNVGMRADTLRKLQGSFPTVESTRVFRPLCWILGEYSRSLAEIETSFKVIWASIGDVPILPLAAEGKEVWGGGGGWCGTLGPFAM